MSSPEKEVLFSQLEERGIKFDKRWGVARLEAALEVVEEVVEAIEEPRPILSNEGSIVDKKPIVPAKDQAWAYIHDCDGDICSVFRRRCRGGIVYTEGSEHIRDYSLEAHGDGHCALAEGFVIKNNAKLRK